MSYLVISLLGLIFSAIFSSFEIAVISSNILRINVWIKQKKIFSNIAKSILNDKENYINVAVLGTNISNVVSTTFGTLFLLQNNIPEGLIIIPIALIILTFGEIFPKSLTKEYPNITLILLSPFMLFFRIVFSPILFILRPQEIINSNSESTRERKKIDNELSDRRDDLEHTLASQHSKDEDKNMILNVFEYTESSVHDVMTGRENISAVDINESLNQILHKFIDSGHSKLPVYEGSINNIKGLITLYDFFKKPERIEDIINPIHFVPYSKPIDLTMIEFQHKKTTLAIVLDKDGNTAGLITAEDIFEEILGEFDDEFDEDDTLQTVINKDGSITVNGRMEYERFNEKHGNVIPTGQYETVAGYIISEIGRIPSKGEDLFLPIGQIKITQSSGRKINKLVIYPTQN